MKCLYCDDSYIDRKSKGLPKCNKCKVLYFFNEKTHKIREVVFFVNINDEFSYRVDHNIEDNKTLIYSITIEGKYVKMKVIFSTELFNITPHNAEKFFRNKLKLYQLFS